MAWRFVYSLVLSENLVSKLIACCDPKFVKKRKLCVYLFKDLKDVFYFALSTHLHYIFSVMSTYFFYKRTHNRCSLYTVI